MLFISIGSECYYDGTKTENDLSCKEAHDLGITNMPSTTDLSV